MQRLITSPTDIAGLVFFRIWFGLVIAWGASRYLNSNWLFDAYIAPKMHFKYYGFEWVHPWPGIGMYYHMAAILICGLCVAAGFLYRPAIIALFVLFAHYFLLDQTNYLNHYYLVVLVAMVMMFMPAHRALSVDAWMRPKLRQTWIAAWSPNLLRLMLAIVYSYAAIAKMTPDWLRGEPVRMWLAGRQDLTLFGPLWHVGEYLTYEWVVYAFTYGGLLFDLLIVPLLFFRRTRVFGYLWCLAFHLLNSLLFNIGIFPWFMIGATLIFFGDAWPRSIFNWPRTQPRPTEPFRSSRLLTTTLVLFVAFQVLFPFRHFLYPGMVHWTEEGHRFSWHMKLRDKDATAEIRVIDPRDGSERLVDLDRYLTSRQKRKMPTRPDMLLQFCHFVADEYERETKQRPQVKARVMCSLNGRPPRLLVDEQADLAKEPRSLLPASWILPFE